MKLSMPKVFSMRGGDREKGHVMRLTCSNDDERRKEGWDIQEFQTENKNSSQNG